MHAAVMDSDMKYVLTWTPRENDIVFQIEVNNPTFIQEKYPYNFSAILF